MYLSLDFPSSPIPLLLNWISCVIVEGVDTLPPAVCEYLEMQIKAPDNTVNCK